MKAMVMGAGLLIAIGLAPASEARAGISPAERQIEAARETIRRRPDDVRGYNELAIGFTRKARETGETAWYDRAAQALDSARTLDASSAASQRVSAWIAMGRHEFGRARAISRSYTRRNPADPWGFSALGDSLMELGRYREAESAYQTMVDLRPGPAAWARVAYVREVAGDLDGARELMRMAWAGTSARESEDRAWLLVQQAHLEDVVGNAAAAEALLRRALETFPGYHYALSALAALTLRDGRFEEARDLASQAIEAADHAERRLVLAGALRALGRPEEAAGQEATFERMALEHADAPDNENHDLVLFYLGPRREPVRALEIARREAGRRRDVQTLDRLAVALEACGHPGRARRVMRTALRSGTRDPFVRAHAAALGVPGIP